MEEILLSNRYGDKNILKRDEGSDYWVLMFGSPADAHYRVIFQDTDSGRKIKAIDPSGGPFLSIGSKVGGKLIKKIEEDDVEIKFYLEDE